MGYLTLSGSLHDLCFTNKKKEKKKTVLLSCSTLVHIKDPHKDIELILAREYCHGSYVRSVRRVWFCRSLDCYYYWTFSFLSCIIPASPDNAIRSADDLWGHGDLQGLPRT